jgi:simple sugar transport system permease protein
VAVGGNRHGAAEAGIKVRLVIIRNFIMCAACAGFVGVLEAVRTTSVQPDPSGANAVLFDGISAAVIGGTLLAGGSGTVVGALFGALLLGILNDGLIIKGVNADYLSFYLGLAIIIAMAANTYVGRVRTGAGRG